MRVDGRESTFPDRPRVSMLMHPNKKFRIPDHGMTCYLEGLLEFGEHDDR